MFNLEKSLKEWVLKGFINDNEANQILRYESNKPQSSYIILSIVILGVIILGIGVISIIAANWDKIPANIKLINDFLLLIICGIGILEAYRHQKELIYESLVLLFMLLCLASIGLISQIYHLSGEFYEALLFWCVITAPIMLCADYRVTPFLWMGALFLSFFYRTFYYYKPPVCQFLIHGFCRYHNFVAGIEQFYIPEVDGKKLNAEISDKKASILIVIPKNGQAVVKDLLIDGKSYRTFVNQP